MDSSLAEYTSKTSPDGMQRLLPSARRDEELACDDLRRQCTGTARKITNCCSTPSSHTLRRRATRSATRNFARPVTSRGRSPVGGGEDGSVDPRSSVRIYEFPSNETYGVSFSSSPKNVVHHRRSTADGGDDHVPVDGLGYVGGLVAYGVADLLDWYAVAAHDRYRGAPASAGTSPLRGSTIAFRRFRATGSARRHGHPMTAG